jgi:hypothetical protein
VPRIQRQHHWQVPPSHPALFTDFTDHDNHNEGTAHLCADDSSNGQVAAATETPRPTTWTEEYSSKLPGQRLERRNTPLSNSTGDGCIDWTLPIHFFCKCVRGERYNKLSWPHIICCRHNPPMWRRFIEWQVAAANAATETPRPTTWTEEYSSVKFYRRRMHLLDVANSFFCKCVRGERYNKLSWPHICCRQSLIN